MKALLNQGRTLITACLWTGLLSFALAGCGGGGKSSDSGGGAGTGGSASAPPVILTGVIATGAPLIGATVSVVDGNGDPQGTTVASLVDGIYEVTLSSAAPTLPLMIQAQGMDMSGAPVLLHSVVQSITTGTNVKTRVHVNPLTDAVTALLLGGNPRPFFQNAKTDRSGWALLNKTSALTAAMTFVRLAVNANLVDAKATDLTKLTDLTKVDFFQDATFAANMTGLDAAIDGLRIQFGRDPIGGNELMYVSNRLILAGRTELTINLATAKTGLGQTTPSATAAITTTAKTTTGNSTLMPFAAALEKLRTDINALMAQRALSASFQVSTITSTSYQQHDGVESGMLASNLASYGNNGWHLSRWQILGCLDNPWVTKCNRVAVAALVVDDFSAVKDVFRNAVSYTNTTKWTFIGNDRRTFWQLAPSTWAVWDAAGPLTLTTAPLSTGRGVFFDISSEYSGTAQLNWPSNSRMLNACGTTGSLAFCLGATETGDLIADKMLTIGAPGMIGLSDAAIGTAYTLDTGGFGIADPDPNTTLLTTDLPAANAYSAYPLPDGLSVATPLTSSNLRPGLVITWNTWAARNPHLRMVEVRSVISSPTAPVIKTVRMLPLAANQATLPAMTAPLDATGDALWLIAEDGQGRRYISKVVAAP
ncbi:MAG: hypothetical protein Q7U28_14885 [Aquabacterium sp.]|nr:hypothetical protein [Aquabacterium sp.]